jgi:polysaccharide biosynthesis/export protein
MKSGTLSFTRGHRLFVFFFSTCFALTGLAAAQQPSSNQNPAEPQTNTPAATPAAQPVEQTINPSTTPLPTKADDSTKTNTNDSTQLRLGPGDLIEVSVYNVPELTTKARVSNAGDIYLPLIDYVHVEGTTQEEAQALIEKRLSEGGFVRNPHVSIFIDEASSQGVIVLGEVVKPGIYPDVADHKLYEIISEAGGFSQAAAHKVAILRRNVPDAIRLDLPRNLADNPSDNIEVLPGDTITVPRAPVIYVVGDVGRPSGLAFDNGTLTVLQALALAGGANHTAKLGAARIIRKGPTGMTETKIEIKKMLEAKIPDYTLQPDDILFIPVSGARVFAGRSFDLAMSAAAAVSIYAIHP